MRIPLLAMATRSGSRGTGARTASDRWAWAADDRWVWAALTLLLVAGAALLIRETRAITFRDDEWLWIQYRRGGGLATLIRPYNQHFVPVGLTIYRLLLAIAGLRTYLPYRLVGSAAQLGCVALVFLYARPRVGGYLAWLAALLVLAFGPGADAFLWPFNDLTIVLAVDAGIGVLLALDRGDRRGNIAAAVVLGLALACDDIGVAVAAGVLVELVLRRRWRELWVVAVPLALYALWFVVYQHPITPSPLSHVARFVVDAAASVMSSLAGLSGANVLTYSDGHFLRWGTPLLVLGLLVLAWRVWRLWRAGHVPARLAGLAAIALAFWVTVGIGRSYLRVGPLVLTATGHEGRYVYVGAVFVLLLAVEAARGAQAAPGWARAIIGVLVLAAVWSNLGSLRDDAHFERNDALVTRASLGAVQMTRAIVSPSFAPAGFVFSLVRAGPYLAAVRALGSPAATPAEIAGDPDAVRLSVDTQLIQIHHLRLAPVGGIARCARRVGAGTATAVTLGSGTVLVQAGTVPVKVSVRRFSTAFEPIGAVPAGALQSLRIGPDGSSQPWRVSVGAGTRVVCIAG